jgi:hypothetical protein
MAALRDPEAVYSHFIEQFGYDGDGEPNAIALFAFALVEREKFDWLCHYRAENAAADPTPAEMQAWYANKPAPYFKEKGETAIWWYKAVARSLLVDEMEAARKSAVKEYIGDRLKFWPQLWVSLCCNVVFIALLGALAMYVVADFSPIAWVKTHIAGNA